MARGRATITKKGVTIMIMMNEQRIVKSAKIQEWMDLGMTST
jgi:hypothetical protein